MFSIVHVLLDFHLRLYILPLKDAPHVLRALCFSQTMIYQTWHQVTKAAAGKVTAKYNFWEGMCLNRAANVSAECLTRLEENASTNCIVSDRTRPKSSQHVWRDHKSESKKVSAVFVSCCCCWFEGGDFPPESC